MEPDTLKIIVILIALFYFNTKVKQGVRGLNFWIMNTGLVLLLAASVLDFFDGIKSFDYCPILGKEASLHDVLEDQFFDTPGLALLIFGAFREMIKKK